MKKQDGDINIKGRFAAGRDVNIGKYSNFKWLIGSLIVLTFIVLGLIYREDVSVYLGSLAKFPPEDTKELKVLLLPFQVEQDVQGLYVNYQDALESAIIKKQKNDSLNIIIKSIKGVDSPKTDKEAEDIATKKNADIVIWGSYTEIGDSSRTRLKVRLRYLLVKDFQLPYANIQSSDEEGDLGYDVSKLREGYLQNDLYYLLNWIEGISAFNQSDYKRALENFSALKNDSLLLYQYDFYALDNLAEIFLVLGREEFAFPVFDVLLNKIEENSQDITDLEKASIYSKMGIAYSYKGEAEKSLQYHQKAIDILDSYRDESKKVIALKSSVYSSMGVQYTRMTQLEKAEEYLSACLRFDSMLIQKGVDRHEMREIINNRINMSNLKLAKRELSATLETLLDIEKAAKEILSDNDRLWGAIYNNIGNAYFNLGNYMEALNYQKKDMEFSEKIYDKHHRDLGKTYNNMAVYYDRLDSTKMSLFYQRKAIEISEYNDEERITDALASMYNNYAVALADDEQFEKSIEFNQKSIDIRERISKSSANSNLATSYNNMAYTYRKMKEFDKALPYHDKAIEVSVRLNGAEDIYTGIYLSKKAESYFGKRDFLSTLEIVREVERIYVNYLPSDHSLFIDLIKLKEQCLANLN